MLGMKLATFINKLQKLEKRYGGELEVAMADYIPVVSPLVVYCKYLGKRVIITDEK